MNTAIAFHPFAGFSRCGGRLATRLSSGDASEERQSRSWSPAVDIAETDAAIVLKVDLPDVKLEDIEVFVEDETLHIRGHRAFQKDDSVTGYRRIERAYGDFVRRFTLSDTVDTEKLSAEYKNGVLSVTLPKKEAAKPKQVKVQVQG